jgi:hypothetical protein
MTNGNDSPKPCECCRELFTPNKYTPHQKYCKNCSKTSHKKLKDAWRLTNGREYMRKYMQAYRRINPLATFILFLLLSGIANAETWLNYKKDHGFDDYSGSLGLSGTYQKPPTFELNYKLNNSYITLNRISLRKRGWMPKLSEEEEQGFFSSEPKEAGSYSLEYGRTGTTNETSLLESDSVYGWKASLGQVSEILWGRGSYGDRIAAASFNTDKFSFFVIKSYGEFKSEQNYDFITNEFDADITKNLPKASAQPRTKYEGGDLYVPFEWRQVRGNFEVAARHYYDEELKKDKRGLSFAFNATSPRIIFSFRNVGQGFESQTRTTDISIKGIFYQTEKTNLNAGYRILNFSSKAVATRHSFLAGLQQKVGKFMFNLDGEFYRQGKDTSIQMTGAVSGSLFGTNLSIRRSENITGFTTSSNNSLSISRKEGSISLSYGTSKYTSNKAANLQCNLYINLWEEMRVGAGMGRSVSETATAITKTIRANYSLSFRNTNLNINLSPSSETYTISREFNLNKLKIGTSLALGATYQRFVGGDGLTGNLTYAW